MDIKGYLDSLIQGGIYEISDQKPDPIIIARRHRDEYAALVASLFAYGNVKAIISFLNRIDYSFNNITFDESLYYRFQNPQDVYEFLKTMHVMKKNVSLNELFMRGYRKNKNPVEGIGKIIEEIYKATPHRSKGFEFLIGKIPPKGKTKTVSPYKRWNMFLRWMVRDKYPDLGMWKGVEMADLIIPLDTHTHKISLKLQLLKRKTYDLQSALELTRRLKEFDPKDPLKYDFALYRIGQLGINVSRD